MAFKRAKNILGDQPAAPVDAGLRLCEQVLAETDTEPGLASIATQVLGLLYGFRGEFERGRVLLEQAGAMQIELGMEIARAAGTTMMSGALTESTMPVVKVRTRSARARGCWMLRAARPSAS